MKIRKPGTLEHPDLGSGLTRGRVSRIQDKHHVLHASPRLRVEATDLLLEFPRTLMAAQAAHTLAKRALKPAYNLNTRLQKGVLVNMLDEWPFAMPEYRIIGLHPLEQRYNARHSVWHESGHLAHFPHDFQHLKHSAFRRVFQAWRIESRKRMPAKATEVNATYLRYLTNMADESRSRTNRRLPALWRKANVPGVPPAILSGKATKRCAKHASGWAEFLAEAYVNVHMPCELLPYRFQQYQRMLEMHFHASLKAYRKALGDDRRLKRREVSWKAVVRMAFQAKQEAEQLPVLALAVWTPDLERQLETQPG